MKNDKILEAILSEAEYAYEFDVTTGIVEHDIIGKNGMNYSRMMGLTAPYPFDEAACDRVTEQTRTRYAASIEGERLITREVLLSAFDEGEKSVSMVVYSDLRKAFLKLSYYLWRSETDGHVWALSVCEDTTYRMEERQLAIVRETNRRLEEEISTMNHIHEALTSGGWKIKFDETGAITSCIWSDKFRQMLGYQSEEEFPNSLSSWSDRLHPDDKERALSDLWDTIWDYSGQKTYDIEYRLCMKSGEYQWFRAAGSFSRRENGLPVSFDGLFINMNDKHIAETKLRGAMEEAERAKNKALLENEIISSIGKMYFAIYRIDLKHNAYEEVSGENNIYRISGHTGNAQEYMDTICHTFVVPESRECCRQFFVLSTLSERLAETDTVELEYHATDGNWHEARFIAKKRDESGMVTNVLFLIKLITREKQIKLENEKKQLEQAKNAADAANKAKTTFLLNMSHDIRTPMNAIIGYAQLMKKKLTDPTLLHFEEKMEQSSNFLLSLINNVLDMARIESGEMELDAEYSSTGDIISGVLNVFDAQIKAKNLNVHYSIDVQHKDIICDRLKIQDIFTNLISNAVKYTTEGGTITITTREVECDEPGYVKIESEIADTGIGMSKDFLPHVFDTFTREKNTTAGKVAGTGLGMPIVKKYVELMEGTIVAESELGKGSKFTVTLKHKIAERTQIKSWDLEKMESQAIMEAMKGKHFLLAEDNELNAEIATLILEEYGITVEHVVDGVQCVERVEHMAAGTFDLVLMDVQMPNMDGYKATQVIRRLPDERKSRIPVIAMTANAFEEDRQKALESGMNEFISKPIKIEKLMQVLADVCIS